MSKSLPQRQGLKYICLSEKKESSLPAATVLGEIILRTAKANKAASP